ncbi:MAG: glycoside hydrolase family 2 [Deltaproteobacteria bacterium]|nr:glycoside hydrolase family 2 [Deltaproteobacteria bacterium]
MTASASLHPRPEYPRPHRVRPRWQNLNGVWEFAFDDDDRGLAQGWETGQTLSRRITVPFTFEAPLSGIGEPTAHPVVWYRRRLEVPPEFLGQRLLLHIGACDYSTRIWVNGRAAGTHCGGYSPISCEVQELVRPGSNELVVRVEDRPVWSQPRGKQIVGDAPVFIDYDRVTGIWQTVWIEPVPDVYIEDCWSRFSLAGSRLVVQVYTNREFAGEAEAVVSFAGTEMASGRAYLQERREGAIELTIANPRLWSPADPALYDIKISLHDGGAVVDAVQTYAGLREFSSQGRTVLLNGEPFYFRGVLDQGYFPGGWYTAASDGDLKRDIELMQAMGFNGARKHQKAEDPRWLYWADRLGFVVWAEIGNGRDFCSQHVQDLTREWTELVRRDRLHPAIMAWVPLNESWGVDAVDRNPAQQHWVRTLYHLTKSLDPTRLVVANDGWQFLTGDLWGLHSYVSDGPALARHLRAVLANPTTELIPGRQAALPGTLVSDIPVMLTELGGVTFRDPARPVQIAGAWGYDVVTDAAEFAGRLRALVEAVRAQPEFSGLVWTQLTDVQQEANGLLYFDRTPKLPLAMLREIFE